MPLLSGDVGSLKEAAWMSRLGSLCWNCMRGVALNGSLEARNYSFPSMRTIWPPSWSYYWLSACRCCWIMLRATLFSKMLNDWGDEGNLSLILDEETPPVAGGCCYWEGWSPPIWFIWRRALYIWSFLPSSSSLGSRANSGRLPDTCWRWGVGRIPLWCEPMGRGGTILLRLGPGWRFGMSNYCIPRSEFDELMPSWSFSSSCAFRIYIGATKPG